MIQGLIPSRAKRILSSPKHPDWLWRVKLTTQYGTVNLKFTTHVHLSSEKVKNEWSYMCSLFLNVFMEWTGATLPLHLSFLHRHTIFLKFLVILKYDVFSTGRVVDCSS